MLNRRRCRSYLMAAGRVPTRETRRSGPLSRGSRACRLRTSVRAAQGAVVVVRPPHSAARRLRRRPKQPRVGPAAPAVTTAMSQLARSRSPPTPARSEAPFRPVRMHGCATGAAGAGDRIAAQSLGRHLLGRFPTRNQREATRRQPPPLRQSPAGNPATRLRPGPRPCGPVASCSSISPACFICVTSRRVVNG